MHLTVAVNDRLFPLKSISYAGLVVGFLASEFLTSKQITIVLFRFSNFLLFCESTCEIIVSLFTGKVFE